MAVSAYCSECNNTSTARCKCGFQGIRCTGCDSWKTKYQDLEKEKKIVSPTAREQQLRAENQSLTTTLTLKATEQAELQAQIRALHTQLSERENQQPNQSQISKLVDKLELVKQQLTKWTNLLTNRHA